MRAITIHQPWASLIALGEKTIETRSWPTRYRGPIAIHAGKLTRERAEDCLEDPYRELLVKHGLKAIGDLPWGAVVAVATLADCVRMTGHMYEPASVMEHELGWFAPGRYAWHLSDVVLLPTPVPARGKQGFWDVDLGSVAEAAHV